MVETQAAAAEVAVLLGGELADAPAQPVAEASPQLTGIERRRIRDRESKRRAAAAERKQLEGQHGKKRRERTEAGWTEEEQKAADREKRNMRTRARKGGKGGVMRASSLIV